MSQFLPLIKVQPTNIRIMTHSYCVDVYGPGIFLGLRSSFLQLFRWRVKGSVKPGIVAPPPKNTIASQSHPVTGFNIVWFDFFSCLKCLHSFCIQDSRLPELFCSSQASSHVGIFLSFWSSSIEQCPFSPIVIGSDKQTVQTVKLALSLLF